MTSEKLYALATENLEVLCNGYAKECNVGPACEFFEQAKKHPSDYARYHPDLAAALEIWSEAREDVLKGKNGGSYAAVKRLVKSASKSYRRDMQGCWTDSEGRQCFCDGYRAVRLKTHMVGFDEVAGIDLDPIMAVDGECVELTLPTSGELKLCIAEQKGRDRKFYDFGDGLPRVDAQYLKDMMETFPGATVKSYGQVKPLIFESEKGDGILLPVRKTA